MRRRWKIWTLVFAVIVYLAFGIRGWLGIEEITIRNENDTYWAAVYSHSKLVAPFLKTHDVLVPSAGDLNSHTVFETYGFWQKVEIHWVDSQNLQITCRHCSQTKLLMTKVDNINVRLITL